MSITAVIIITVCFFGITYMIGELLAEGRLRPSRKKREQQPDNSESDNGQGVR